MKNTFLLMSLAIALLLPGNSVSAQNERNLIVLVKYKTQPAKETQALNELNKLVEQVKKEPNYVKIVIHVDPSDRSNVLLYEEWSDEEYYKGDHLQTPHLRKFMNDSKGFLAGPPEISFWKVQK